LALELLQRLKAVSLATRVLHSRLCDDTYSNKSWCIVGQGMFAPQGRLGHSSHSCPTLVRLARWRRRWSPLLPPPVGFPSVFSGSSLFSFFFLALMPFPPRFAGRAMSVREGATSARGCVRGSRECRYDCFFITLRWLSRFGCLPHRPYQAHRMCVACPCLLATQQPAANARLPHRVLLPLPRRAVFRL
jgi:hypothetical protein